MPQIVKGLQLGRPGVVGSPAIYILYGSGDPNAITDFGALAPNTPNFDAGSANSIPQNSVAVGSLFLRTDAPDSTHALYVKTASPNVWTNK